jgi:hypothetical protein
VTAADVLVLLRRDHAELVKALGVLASIGATDRELREALDAVRIGLAAHVEGEGAMLREALEREHPPAFVYLLCSQVLGAHLAQEGALHALERTRRGGPAMRERALHLRALIDHHADHEKACVVPALRDYLPTEAYAALAAAYASARLRALGTIPIAILDEASAGVS